MSQEEVQKKIAELQDHIKKLKEDTELKIKEINSKTDIKNEIFQNVKEKKTLGAKVAGLFGVNKKITEKRLSLAKETLKKQVENNFNYYYNRLMRNINFYNEQIQIILQKTEFENKRRMIQEQKSEIIARYEKLGYTYYPEEEKTVNNCPIIPQQYVQNMGPGSCKETIVKVPYTDYFKYEIESKTPVEGWTKTTKMIVIPESYEYTPGRAYIGQYGQTNYTEGTRKVIPAEEREIPVWRRPLPAGYPETVQFDDFPTVIESLESKPKNAQTRKRKHKNRKNKSRKN
jgi:hypothetical protein